MGSFQIIRAGAEAIAESQLGMKAAAALGDATTTASKFLSEAYPSCKDMIARATDLFRSPQSLGIETKGAAEMTAAERATTPGGQTYEQLLAAYKREQNIGFAGTRELVTNARATETNGFNAFSRKVEDIQGIVAPGANSLGGELPRSLEGIRKSFQPVASNLEIGSARSSNLHSFVPGESSSLATRIQPSTLRYPPLEPVTGATAARAEQVTAAVDEAGAGVASESAETATVVKGAKRVRRAKASGESETSSGATEAPPRARRASRKGQDVAAETGETAQSESVSASKTRPSDQIAEKGPGKAVKEPVKAEAPAKEPMKAEAPAQEAAKGEEITIAGETVEGEAIESSGPKLNRAARRKLASRKPDRRLARSTKEEEAMAVQRA